MAEDVRTALSGDLEIRRHDGYLRVWHGRAAKTVDEVEVVIAAIEEEMATTGFRDLLFDSRDSDRTPEDVQARLWAWLQNAGLRRVATLIRSEMLGVSVQMQGLTRSVRLRAFASEQKATAWLRER